MSVFWPGSVAPDTMPVRLGRVIHWLSAGVAVFWLVLVGIALVVIHGSKLEDFVWPVFWAIFVAFIGRGARYVLADE